MIEGIEIIFGIAVLIMSVIAHEVSHGYAAALLGDPTARLAGRLSLNPVKHIDPVGSIAVPLISYMLGGFIFGWAKPVPYNPYNLKNQRFGPAIVAAAGPAMNIVIAIIFGVLVRFAVPFGIANEAFYSLASLIVFINVLLALFNLIPIPPLDGSKILSAFLPSRYLSFMASLEQYSFFAVIIFILLFWQSVVPVVYGITWFLVGGM
ncbi:MAG: site-2 protease family protein [Parcubacteria group bacterium]|nr:site-2 protease family protein [Parcubacteria group bacterium]